MMSSKKQEGVDEIPKAMFFPKLFAIYSFEISNTTTIIIIVDRS